ncbi:MAG: rod shape-determining protein [Myxococcales bacterium]|nr:rod shape-determining protein [Myxococcales bacterium]
MLDTVLGLFSQDLAVDLGTSNTRVHLSGRGLLCDEPTALALQVLPDGSREVIATGVEARAMVGRTPPDIEAVHPVRAGRVTEHDVTEALILALMRRAHGRNGWMRPRIVLGVPHRATAAELDAVADRFDAVGTREVRLIPRPVAAAVGAGLPVWEADTVMVVDVGGGTTEISILQSSEVVSSTILEQGGLAMDAAVAAWVEREWDLRIGPRSAEALKIDVGSAIEEGLIHSGVAKGRCLRRGLPRAQSVTPSDVHSALTSVVDAIAQATRDLLDEAPPSAAAAVRSQGVILAGGGSLLRDLDVALRDRLQIPFIVAESPQRAVITGLARILEDSALQHTIARVDR